MHIPGNFLAELWHSISVLQVCGPHPHWASKAYHDLSELHLIAKLLLARRTST